MADVKGKGKARYVSQSEMQREVAKSIEQSSLTYNETVDASLQFLEAAFHTILRLRGVYPLGKPCSWNVQLPERHPCVGLTCAPLLP